MWLDGLLQTTKYRLESQFETCQVHVTIILLASRPSLPKLQYHYQTDYFIPALIKLSVVTQQRHMKFNKRLLELREPFSAVWL